MLTDRTRKVYALIAVESAALNRGAIDVALSIANRCGASPGVIVLGSMNAEAVARACHGLDTAWHLALPDDSQTHQITVALVQALREQRIAWDANTLFITEPDGHAAEIGARVAAQLGAVALGKCDAIQRFDDAGLALEKSSFGGRLHVALQSDGGPYFVSMRGAVSASPASGESKACGVCDVPVSTSLPPAYAIEQHASGERTVNLEGARIVVSGGRGMGGEDGFTALHELATSLGAAVGASLPAVDAGWAPVARQIGQSGKYVSPEVYLGIGVSGTPQHLAGIDPHTRIVAVNKDPEAGIFARARVGVVADWRDFVPELVKALAARS
jgi:electron transfer flavoprotein alpha subunit